MALARRDDETLYPDSDDMGEGELQRLISELLRPLLARFLAERGVVAHVGADQFLYGVRGDPTRRIAPAIYVLPGVPQARIARSWKLWEVGAPSFCLEVASADVVKDYEDTPAILGAFGVRELVIFDPEAGGRRGRHRFHVYRRTAAGFRLSERSNADRVRSRELAAHLRVVGEGDAQRLRVGTGLRGEDLFPTDEERVELERAARLLLEARVAELERKPRRGRKP